MSRVFITGSTDGLGYAAARVLIEEGHEVVLHARSQDRASAVTELAKKSQGIVLGDLSSAVETRRLAEQVNASRRMAADTHNAGVFRVPTRSATPAIAPRPSHLIWRPTIRTEVAGWPPSATLRHGGRSTSARRATSSAPRRIS